MLPKSPIVFAGPSLTKRSKSLIINRQITLQPPVQRLDITNLLAEGYKGVLIIADGLFHQVLAVGHAEIRKAMQAGCTVFGLSSMGAIRAYEMECLGMIGYGKVFEWFKKEEDFQDDEVALLHSPAPSYIAVTEPLVHFRACVADLVTNNHLSVEDGQAIITKLKAVYYGERHREKFYKYLKEVSTIDVKALAKNFDQYRIKQLDLVDFLEKEVWLR